MAKKRTSTASKKKTPARKKKKKKTGGKRPSRLEQFKQAHKWRTAFARLAKERNLGVRDLTARGTRTTVLKDLAKAVSQKVGFRVTYHTVWRFARSDLLPTYLEGKAPKPEEQLAAANEKARRPGGRARRAAGRLEHNLDELEALARELVDVSRRLQRAIQALGPSLRERDDLRRLLAQSLELVDRGKSAAAS